MLCSALNTNYDMVSNISDRNDRKISFNCDIPRQYELYLSASEMFHV